MKSFADICKMTQAEVKTYMKSYLGSKNYNVIDEDGFLYAKGNVPVLLVAHMDTVHKEQCTEVVLSEDGKLSSPQGIGGDDRCGIFIIMSLLTELHCSVLLCEDEERGGIGARKFTKTDHIKNLDVNYMIEFDRKGNSDAVFYTCDNQEFLDFVIEATGFEEANGSFSDISVLMPAAKLSAVNLSSGYYNPHTVTEYVVWHDMMDTVAAAKELINTECDGPFEYIAKTYNYSKGSWGSRYRDSFYRDMYPYSNGYQFSMDDYEDPFHENDAKMAKDNKDIELEVIIPDDVEIEKALYYSGNTKAECWMDFFLDNPDICFNDIITYAFS